MILGGRRRNGCPMRNCTKHDNGRNGNVSYSKKRRLHYDCQRSPGRRDTLLRAGTYTYEIYLSIFRMSLQVLSKLRSARNNFDSPQCDRLGKSPRQPSIYERELENPRLMADPLPQPCPHVYDSAPMRPVSVAIQGIGMLLGDSGPTGRASVFGKFW